MGLEQRIEEFEKRFYSELYLDKNSLDILANTGKEKNLRIPKLVKQRINQKLKEVYTKIENSIHEMGFSGRQCNNLSELVSNTFLQNSKYHYEMEFKDLEDDFFSEFDKEMSSELEHMVQFFTNASKSKDISKYIHIFSRIGSLKRANILHGIIMGRNNITKGKEYGNSEERNEIYKLILSVLKREKGSAKKLFELIGFDIEKDMFAESYKKDLDDFANFRIRFNQIAKLSNLGFLIEPFGGYAVMNVNTEYLLNGCLKIYLTNNAPSGNRGVFYPISKGLFVQKIEEEGDKNTLQHEVEHFIQYSFRDISLTEEEGEYGAFLAGVRFSENPENSFRNLAKYYYYYQHDKINRLLTIISGKEAKLSIPHRNAFSNIVYSLEKKSGVIISSLKGADIIKYVQELHNDFYKKKIGITYNQLKELCI